MTRNITDEAAWQHQQRYRKPERRSSSIKAVIAPKPSSLSIPTNSMSSGPQEDCGLAV
jgi:hypothetical protein